MLSVPDGYSVPCAPGGAEAACALGSLWSSRNFQRSYSLIINDLLPNATASTAGGRWNATAESPWFDYIDYKFSNRPRGGAWGSIPADADSTQQWESGRPHPPGYIEYTNTKVGCIAKSCTIRIAHVATV